MNTDTKEALDFFIGHVNEYGEKASFFYLNAGSGNWMDADGNVKPLGSMSKSYLENCVKMLDRVIREFINSNEFKQQTKGYFELNLRKIDYHGFLKERKIIQVDEECFEVVKNEIEKALEKKKKEAERYL